MDEIMGFPHHKRTGPNPLDPFGHLELVYFAPSADGEFPLANKAPSANRYTRLRIYRSLDPFAVAGPQVNSVFCMK